MNIRKFRNVTALAATVSLGIGVEGRAQHEPEGTFMDIKRLEADVNSPFADYRGLVSGDGLTLVFTSERLGGSHIFIAEREDTDHPFTEVRNLAELNTVDEYATFLSNDALRLHYMLCSQSCDLYVATRAARDEPFGNPQPLHELNTPYFEGGLSLTVDGLEAYFISDRPGAKGHDIWVATRTSVEEPFADVRNLEEVNTFHRDGGLSISADGLTLFWNDFPGAGVRPGGMGGTDIWCASRASRDEPFGEAVNLGSPINTSADDHWLHLSPRWPEDGSLVYFSRGDMDIYQATWRLSGSIPKASFTVSSQSLKCGDEVQVDAAESTAPNGIGGYLWDFGEGATANGVKASHRFSRPGRYFIQLKVTDAATLVEDAASLPVSISCCGGEVAPWTSADIGEPRITGGARLEGLDAQTCIAVCAGGRGIIGSTDELHFVYQELTGDASLTARISDLSGGSTGARAGLMIRETLDPTSRHGAVFTQPGLFRWVSRENTGAVSRHTRGGAAVLPAWLRMEREGDDLIGSSSPDGVTWTEVTRGTITGLAERVYVGIAATGGDPGVSSAFQALEARFCEITLSPQGVRFRRGDCNGDGAVDISDAVCFLTWLFLGGAEPGCAAAANVDGVGAVDITDPIYLLTHLFLGGPAPVEPFPDCGPALATDKELGCQTPPKCQ